MYIVQMVNSKQLYQRCICMLIALAFSCLSVSNVFAQANHIQMQDATVTGSNATKHQYMTHQKQRLAAEMAEHCSHVHSPAPSKVTTTQMLHHAGCLDCQFMHCQTLNYALTEPSVSIELQHILQEKEMSKLPDYTSQVLIGHWQQILRPPRA
ncbi:hypothetical protein [Acinetobacter sp.]|uniref:hypothetical protein n=1 Tax=Acinetobacter sp. TaxID=472 RepID=UPI0031D9DBA4